VAVSPEQYASINLPHAQTVLGRIERSLVALSGGNPVPPSLAESLDCLDRLLRPYFDDPPEEEAVSVADSAARIKPKPRSRITLLIVPCIRNLSWRGENDRLGTGVPATALLRNKPLPRVSAL